MAHHKYTTTGFIISSRNSGESNKIFSIITRDFGMIQAGARSVREVRSKLRLGLKLFALTECSLIHGKNGWKIAGAREIYNIHEACLNDSDKISIVTHIFSLLGWLLTGEEKNESLFFLLDRSFKFLHGANLSTSELKNFECILVLALLAQLGYVGDNPELALFIPQPEWSRELLLEMEKIRKIALLHINKSLESSQL